jgi:hypothetical protein
MGVLFTILFTSVRVTFVLITLALVSVLGLTRISGGAVLLDPFAPYADILPGQSRDAVLERGFNCQFNRAPRFEESCALSLETGLFSAFQATIAPDTSRVRRAVFTPRDDRLTLAQLVLLWGSPQVAVYGPTTNFRWRNIHVVAIPQAYTGHFSYGLPILYVAFDATH